MSSQWHRRSALWSRRKVSWMVTQVSAKADAHRPPWPSFSYICVVTIYLLSNSSIGQRCVYHPVRQPWTHNPLGSISSMRSLTRSHISRPEGIQLDSVHGNEGVNRVPLSHHRYIQVGLTTIHTPKFYFFAFLVFWPSLGTEGSLQELLYVWCEEVCVKASGRRSWRSIRGPGGHRGD